MARFGIKRGVNVAGLRAEMVPALLAADRILEAIGAELIITSALDGEHKAGSRHFLGLALDFRTRHLTGLERSRFASELQAALGNQYDVVLEKTHVHVEFDP